jgi:8-oxo-dGTP pyrophosphatase MutT (NUDIX family)
MSIAAPEPVTPRPASTLVLVRDGAGGIEVLLIARHQQAGFAAGAMVFPGGKIDARDAGLAGRCRLDAPLAEGELAMRVAAIRETWEESGLLLCRKTGAEVLLTKAETRSLRAERGAEFEKLLGAPELELATDLLLPFAHWITPRDRPKRFDTRFFIAPFEADQEPLHDGYESTEACWRRPEDVVADADEGKLSLVFATRMNLLRIAQSKTAAAALDAARVAPVVTVVPEFVKREDGPYVRIPLEAGYGVTEVPAGKIPRA